jgi:ferredoxin-type protein NapF
MSVCKNGGISYVFAYGKRNKNETVKSESDAGKNAPVSEKRRQALIAMGALGGALIVKSLNFRPLFSSTTRIKGIAPPGAVSLDRFKKNCTACYACISACPNNIIRPSKGEYGLEGLMLPVLDFDKHFCSYECHECSTVCPNNALMPLTLEDKRLTQVGQARFFLERCIVHTDGTDCGACDEHCPTKAISMVPYGEDGLYIPSLNENLCIGCGGCEYICPAVPDKAMIVYALATQGRAQKPTEEKQEEIVVDEFGF